MNKVYHQLSQLLRISIRNFPLKSDKDQQSKVLLSMTPHLPQYQTQVTHFRHCLMACLFLQLGLTLMVLFILLRWHSTYELRCLLYISIFSPFLNLMIPQQYSMGMCFFRLFCLHMSPPLSLSLTLFLCDLKSLLKQLCQII